MFALLVWAQAAAAVTRVYGLEHGIEGATERVLVFADGPVTPQLVERDPRNAELTLPGAGLDPSAPRSARDSPGRTGERGDRDGGGQPEAPGSTSWCAMPPA